MSQQVRFAPGASLDAVFWKAGTITVQRADGSEVPIAPGHHPAWSEPRCVVFNPPEEGSVMFATVDDGIDVMGQFIPPVPAGNTLTAAAGKVAVHRTDPRRVLTSWGETCIGYTDPSLSANGGWMAMLAPDLPNAGKSSVVISDLADDHDAPVRVVYIGAPTRPRFSNAGTTLVWEDSGALYGIRDVANPSSPVVRLTRPGDACFHGVPVWAPERGELLLCYVQAVSDTEADIIVAGWESCVAQQPTGYVVARSGGSGFDLDCKEAA